MEELVTALKTLMPEGQVNYMMFITPDKESGGLTLRWRHYKMTTNHEVFTLTRIAENPNNDLLSVLQEMIVVLRKE